MAATNNIKRFAFINLKNTAGIVGINACGDEAVALRGKPEAPSALAKCSFTQTKSEAYNKGFLEAIKLIP